MSRWYLGSEAEGKICSSVGVARVSESFLNMFLLIKFRSARQKAKNIHLFTSGVVRTQNTTLEACYWQPLVLSVKINVDEPIAIPRILLTSVCCWIAAVKRKPKTTWNPCEASLAAHIRECFVFFCHSPIPPLRLRNPAVLLCENKITNIMVEFIKPSEKRRSGIRTKKKGTNKNTKLKATTNWIKNLRAKISHSAFYEGPLREVMCEARFLFVLLLATRQNIR